MSGRHPSESDLALLAGGDCGLLRRFRLNRHVARCGDCRDTLASFGELRSEVRDMAAPGFAAHDVGSDVGSDAAWNRLAGEMRANIRLGLAAGECIGEGPAEATHRTWMPKFAMGMAGVVVLAGVGMFLHGLLPHDVLPGAVSSTVLESTGTGIAVRTDKGSMTLMNQGDVTGAQTITSQGAIRDSYVDGNTGTVTITSVYVE